MLHEPILHLDLPGIRKIKSGKVRELFDLGDQLLFVATDRISAFDCIMPNGIPQKGEILTLLSHFWFGQTEAFVPNHRLRGPDDPLPEVLRPHEEVLRGRSMLVRKTEPLTIECVVRGYLAGSGWKEYQQSGTVCGIALPPGLQQADELPAPIFTPATKAESGHDMNISFEEAAQRVGPELAGKVRDLSLQIYAGARDHARSRGVIIADTKFEFGIADHQLYLIDEVLTPDSSRFWPQDRYQPGRSQPSFDKQFVRDYLETLEWDKTPPAPALPNHIIEQTAAKYREAYQRLTDTQLP